MNILANPFAVRLSPVQRVRHTQHHRHQRHRQVHPLFNLIRQALKVAKAWAVLGPSRRLD